MTAPAEHPAPGTTSPPTTPATPNRVIARLRRWSAPGAEHAGTDVARDVRAVLGELESSRDVESYVRAELEHVRAVLAASSANEAAFSERLVDARALLHADKIDDEISPGLRGRLLRALRGEQ